MKSEIKFIELKTGYSDNGPAWIGKVSFSKSGKTIYFDGKAFQSLNGNGISGNFQEVETGDEYWISGVKKNQQDRHSCGGGKIYVERRILADYLKMIDRKTLKEKDYDIIDVDEEIPTERFNLYENENFEDDCKIDDNKRFLQPTEMNDNELEYFIDFYHKNSISGKYLKGRKYSRNKMNELIVEKEKRFLNN